MSQENVETVRRLHESFAKRDYESAFSAYDPQIEWDMSRSGNPLPGEQSVYHGHDGVRSYWRTWLAAWEFIDAPVERLIDAEEHVVSLFGRSRARGRSSGVEVEMPPWAMLWTLRDGKVVRMRIYSNHSEALEAVGLRE